MANNNQRKYKLQWYERSDQQFHFFKLQAAQHSMWCCIHVH